MKTKIKIIQDYFLNKIYNCEFEIVKKTEYRASIIIGNEYNFSLWVGSGFESFKVHEGSVDIGSSSNFIHLDIEASKAKKAWDYIENYNKPTEAETRAEKVALIAKLTKELNQ